jgi:hypothetical protein
MVAAGKIVGAISSLLTSKKEAPATAKRVGGGFKAVATPA